ncbi:MAG: hypothetical protein F6K41_35110, partial [Symploca sp. SIO3E6]|nr:hypothetical protein [Caldora sp. SIO3E6]
MESSLKLYEEILAANPKHFSTLFKIAGIYLALEKELNLAIQQFAKILIELNNVLTWEQPVQEKDIYKRKSKSGRLVWNHLTHIPGLIEVLERLKSYQGVQTITPGVIGRAKSHCPSLILKVSVPIRGGFKLIARQGKTFQEVFVL